MRNLRREEATRGHLHFLAVRERGTYRPSSGSLQNQGSLTWNVWGSRVRETWVPRT